MFVTTNYDCLIEEISTDSLFEIKGGSPCWRELQYQVYKQEKGTWYCFSVHLFIWEDGDLIPGILARF